MGLKWVNDEEANNNGIYNDEKFWLDTSIILTSHGNYYDMRE